jgi:hypothetical protein
MRQDSTSEQLSNAADEYGQARDASEEQALTAAQQALIAAAIAAGIILAGDESEDSGDGIVDYEVINVSKLVRVWLLSIALSALRSQRRVARATGAPVPDYAATRSIVEPWVESAGVETTARLDQLALSFTERARAVEAADPSRPASEAVEAKGSAWAKVIARTEATRMASEAQIAMAQGIAALSTPTDSGVVLEPVKIWITRGDARVRALHRKLHGEMVEGFDNPFWRWPTGKELKHPGDLDAPLDAVIGCRCVLMFVPTADLGPDVLDVFKPATLDTSFDLAASAAPLEYTHMHPSLEFGIALCVLEYRDVASR